MARTLIHEYLLQAAHDRPDKTALVCGSSAYTYAQVSDGAIALAKHLSSSGLEKGSRVATYLENGFESVVSLFGILLAGGCVVPIGTVTPLDRLGHLVKHSGAKILVAPGSRARQVRECLSGKSVSPHILWTGDSDCLPGELSFRDVLTKGERTDPPAISVIDLDLAAIIYTSGSTGQPKGVTHTHRSLTTAVDSIIDYLDNSSEDVILCVLHLNFSYGLLQLLATVRTAATLVLEKGIGYPYEVVRQFAKHKVTGFAGSPTIWAMLLQMKGLSAGDFATVRYITNAAAAMPVPFVPQLAELFVNANIFLMHGLTECLRTTYLPPEEAQERPSSVGKGMKNVELWLEDDDGNRLESGKVGELVVRSSTLMAGYWDDPEGTSRMLMPGHLPWERHLHTGDLFRRDEAGYYYFVARKDEMIKSRGEKVSPVEVENAIYRLPEVAECRVVGVPDQLLGNKIRAEIVLRQGASLDETAIKAECGAWLEPYKVPHVVDFVAQLPKTAGGKIMRSGVKVT